MTTGSKWLQPVVYLDMDGVLADLDRHLAETLNIEIDNIERSQFFKSMLPEYTRKQGFATAPKMPYADKLVEMVWELHTQSHVNVAILTSGGQFFEPQSEVVHQKKQWLESNFPHTLAKVAFVATTSGAQKSVFASGRAFLIDDHMPNIQKFLAAGGWGTMYNEEHYENGDMGALRDNIRRVLR